MWSTWGESAKASLQQALEKTGDALDKAGESLTKAAVSAGKNAREQHEHGSAGAAVDVDAGQQQEEDTDMAATIAVPNKQQELLKNFQTGWTSVVQSTRQSIVKAQEAVKKHSTKCKNECARRARQWPSEMRRCHSMCPR
jgi:hypothetical protein